MIKFVTYFKSTNPSPIDGIGRASDEELAMMQETDEVGVVIVAEDVSEETHMVQDGLTVNKPTWGVVVNVTGNIVVLTNLPTGDYELFVDMGEPVGLLQLSETEFELTDAGDYTIVIRPGFPYIEERHDVTIE